MWRYILWTLAVFVASKAQDSFDNPRTFYLHTGQLSWFDAQDVCQRSGGNVASVTDISTIPDMHFDGYVEGELLWIGLRRESSGHWYWESGKRMAWSNWSWDNVEKNGDCVLAKATYPYWWLTVNCSYQHAYVCEYPEGECQIIVYPNSSIIGINDKYIFNQSLKDCQESCETVTDILCRSFEYNHIQKYCQFSQGNRWINYEYYIPSDPNWYYYHRTCITGFLYQPEITVDIMPSSTAMMSSSEVVKSSSIIPALTQCAHIWVTTTTTVTVTITASFSPVSSYISPPSSHFMSMVSVTELSPVEEIKKEIIVLKEKKKQLAKVSVPDKRSSSTAVGVSAAALLCVIGILIVISDFMTLSRDFKTMKDNLSSICTPVEDTDENSKEQNPKEGDYEIAKNTSNLNVPAVHRKNVISTVSKNSDDDEQEQNVEYTTWSVVNPCFSLAKETNKLNNKYEFESNLFSIESKNRISACNSPDDSGFGSNKTYFSSMRKKDRENSCDSIISTHPKKSRKNSKHLHSRTNFHKKNHERFICPLVVSKSQCSNNNVENEEHSDCGGNSKELTLDCGNTSGEINQDIEEKPPYKMGYLSAL